MTLAETLQLIQTFILFLTGVVVFWYTLETSRLRELSKIQVESLYVPKIALYLRDQRKAFVLRNIGNSPAYNISISISKSRFDMDSQKIKLRIINTDYLIPGEERKICFSIGDYKMNEENFKLCPIEGEDFEVQISYINQIEKHFTETFIYHSEEEIFKRV